MLRVLKTQRARRRAVTMISPFVKRSRAAREIPDSIWFDPYFVGFISMLITCGSNWDAATRCPSSRPCSLEKLWPIYFAAGPMTPNN